MKKIYVCIGVDGSGKTTYVQKQLNSETISINDLDIQEVKKLMYNRDMEEQYQLDLIKAIQETKDGEVSVIQLPIELISTSTMCQ